MKYRSKPRKLSPNDALVEKVKAASVELEALRRQVARLKREFLTGKRY